MKRFKRCGIGRWFRLAVVLAVLAAGIFTAGPREVRAAGLLIADGGFGGVLEIEEHDVKVTINNGVAVTRITQVFHNTENRQVEALYTFPVPRGASVANFSMWINGKEMVGEVVEKERAREIYDSYKQTRRDPGLLEQVDYKRFEMRIFPINAGADQKIELTYYQELEIDHDRVTYVYPLATVTRGDLDSRTTGKFAMNVDIKSAIAIRGVESPSHGDRFVVVSHADTDGQASLETMGGSLARDVVVIYGLVQPKKGLDLIASNPPGEDGTFLLTLTAGEDLAALDEGMDYVFLLDISGSMGNDCKLAVSRSSLEAFVAELEQKDRFDVMTFNVQPNPVFGQLAAAAGDAKTRAAQFMRSQQARDGTVLNPAVTAAYRYGDPDRQLNVVIVSDGMTEQDERRTLLQLIKSRPGNARVFCIGVGNEVNRPLLEQMAQDSGGLAAFISHGDDFQRRAKAFRRKLTRPAAAGLSLDIAGVEVYDLEPRVLPNLYHGMPIRIYGRYRGSGDAQITVTGDVRGREMIRTATRLFPAADPGNPEIERMWAFKRVERLQKAADRRGSREDVVAEIIRLGEAFSIVTEYTSFLVLENDAEYRRWKIERRNAQRFARDRVAQADRAEALKALRTQAQNRIEPQPSRVPAPVKQAGQQPQARPQSPRADSSPPAPGPVQTDADPVADNNFGTGPVGPLFLAVAAMLAWGRRRH